MVKAVPKLALDNPANHVAPTISVRTAPIPITPCRISSQSIAASSLNGTTIINKLVATDTSIVALPSFFISWLTSPKPRASTTLPIIPSEDDPPNFL